LGSPGRTTRRLREAELIPQLLLNPEVKQDHAFPYPPGANDVPQEATTSSNGQNLRADLASRIDPDGGAPLSHFPPRMTSLRKALCFSRNPGENPGAR